MGQRREGPRGLVDCALYRPFDVVGESDFGRARRAGINLFALDTLFRYPRDTTLCSFIHVFTFSFT